MAGTSLCLEGAPERGLAEGNWCIIHSRMDAMSLQSELGANVCHPHHSAARSEGLGYLPQAAQLQSRTCWMEALLLTIPHHCLLRGPPSFSHQPSTAASSRTSSQTATPSPVVPPHHRALDPLCCPSSQSPGLMPSLPSLFSDGTNKTACSSFPGRVGFMYSQDHPG